MRKSLSVSNAVLYLVFSCLVSSGLALEFRLEDSGQKLLALTKHNWATVHAITASVFVNLAFLHLWMNRAWVRAILRKVRWPTLVLLGVGLAFVMVTALAPIE